MTKSRPTIASSRSRLLEATAKRMEVRSAREAGELVLRAEVIATAHKFILATKAALRQIPQKLRRAGLLDATGERAALELVDESLREIAAWKSDIDLLEVTGRDNGAPEPAR